MTTPDKTRTCRLIHVRFENNGSFPEFAEPGAVDKVSFAPDFWLVACPGCGHISAMRVGDPKPEETPSWRRIDDDTLKPSINCTGCCGWHGYLTYGNFKPC